MLVLVSPLASIRTGDQLARSGVEMQLLSVDLAVRRSF